MKIKRVLFYVLLINWLLPVYAQIKPISSHFNFLNELYNPAFYGIDEQYKFALNYRNQWARLDGAPSTI
ncbi:MAG TPA: type IX secretion system membrane protein PorP/SprF, partial [Chitinophagales bacterium]|nr:type IX secretion system membrane protein PorP/SprF [Chitinophagales bacterium]